MNIIFPSQSARHLKQEDPTAAVTRESQTAKLEALRCSSLVSECLVSMNSCQPTASSSIYNMAAWKHSRAGLYDSAHSAMMSTINQLKPEAHCLAPPDSSRNGTAADIARNPLDSTAKATTDVSNLGPRSRTPCTMCLRILDPTTRSL
eukprot:3858970-Amphidinium_carterae.1